MPDLNGTLDTVLAFVTIVLVLSMIIQSLQNIIKRLLRMKSRQAEQSLRMLFDYALATDLTKYTKIKYASPILAPAAKLLSKLFGRSEAASVGDTLVEAVKGEVLEMGRKSFWGNAVLDSVSKDDVKRILQAVDAKALGIDTKAIEGSIQAGQSLEEEVKKAIDRKVTEVETWYDTVMPGLAERHERGMKWVSVALSVLVVVFFNANAIEIYKYVASDSAVQKELVKYSENRMRQRAEEEPAKQQDPQQLKADLNELKGLVSDYRKFGLKPLGSWTEFWTNIKNWRTLLGWLAMTLLLSMGAPFWEDALGSLFGLKNTLQGKAKDEQKKTL